MLSAKERGGSAGSGPQRHIFSTSVLSRHISRLLPQYQCQKNTTITSLNYYLPPAVLTPIVMKCFERLVKAHIISKGPSTPPITTTTPTTKAKHSNTQCKASDWETIQKVVRTAEKKNHFTLSRTLLGVRP